MKPAPGSTHGNIAADVIFSLITCGIYGIFWQARLFKASNTLNDDEQFKVLPWILLTLVTCGLYNIYAQYQLGVALDKGLKKEGYRGGESLGLLGLLLSLIGLSIVVMALEQHELNQQVP
jgi:hypothetical protein